MVQQQLRLALAPAASPPAPSAAMAPAVLSVADAAGRCVAVGTSNGRLHLLPLQPHATITESDAFALTLLRGGAPPQLLARPWAALALLPASGGLLCTQAGSGRLLCCHHPAAALELGQEGAEAFLLGCHEDPITTVAVSPCGTLALSADAGGALKLWNLANGAQLAAVWGGTGSGPVTAACFLPDESVATARGGLVSVWRHCGAALELAAELAVTGGSPGSSSAGLGRVVTALAAAGPLLAVGCSDGASLVWSVSGSSGGGGSSDGSRFVQHALLPAPEPASPVKAMGFSCDASLLAVAAGATVTVIRAASGQLMAQLALAAAPISLFWAASGQLLALTSAGTLQPLGAPELPMPAQQECLGMLPPAAVLAGVQTGAAAAAGAGASVPSSLDPAATAVPAARDRGKKSVRFAPGAADEPTAGEQEATGSAAALLQAMAARSPAARHAPPPPLPSHPLLRGDRGGTGGARDAAEAAVAGSRGSGSSAFLSAPRARTASAAAPVGDPPARAARQPPAVQPLYPILDLRALRGLQPASIDAAATSPACSPPGSPFKWQGQRPAAVRPAASTAAACGSAATTRSMRHAATSTEAPDGGPDMSSWQWGGQQEEAAGAGGAAGIHALQQEQGEDQQMNPGGGASRAVPGMPAVEGAEPPRRLRLPTPTQRQASPQAQPLSPGRTSKERCQACLVQQAAAVAPGSNASGSRSKPASPAKLAMLAQLAALQVEAQDGTAGADVPAASAGKEGAAGTLLAVPLTGLHLHTDVAGNSSLRPASAVKLGVACTLEEQQAGVLQAPEVKALTVEEFDASLPLAEQRRQRYARLSRRSMLGRQQKNAHGQATLLPQQQPDAVQDQQDGREVQQHSSSACGVSQQAWPGRQDAPEVTSALAAGIAGGGGEAAAFPLTAAAEVAEPGSRCGTVEAPAQAAQAAGAMELSACFAVCSDAELTSDDEEVGQEQGAGIGHPADRLLVAGAAGEEALAAVDASYDYLSEAASVQPRLPPQTAAAAWPAQQSAQAAAAAAAAAEQQVAKATSCQNTLSADARGTGAASTAGTGPLGQVAGLLRQLDSRLSSLTLRTQRQAGYAPPVAPSSPRVYAEVRPSAAASRGEAAEAARAAVPTGSPAQPPPAACSQQSAAAPVDPQAPAAVAQEAAPPPPAAAAACEPASSLAVPALNSRLLSLHRSALLEEQAKAAAAAAGARLSWEQMQVARRRAATAATTLPPGARLFTGPLPPPEAAPDPACKLSPTRAAALEGAKKQLDEKWLAQQAELRPRLEHLWVAEQRVPQRSGLAPLPPLVVPLPDGRQLAADFLGLRL